MFKKNYWFLRITSIIYLVFCLILAGITYFIVFGEMSKWGSDTSDGSYIDFFVLLGKWWIVLPIISITNAIFCPFFVASIYLHFKYTNKRAFLKYTWFCLFNTFIEDFILLRPIFLILFIIKIWSKNNTVINKNNNYNHLYDRSIANGLFIVAVIVYFVTFASLNNTEFVGWASFCMVIYVIVPKLVMNSYIDIKFSNMNFTRKWITLYLISSFLGIFPYCYYLIKNPIYINK